MKNNIKITVVTASLAAGGAERVISQLLKEWATESCELSLILLNKQYQFYKVPDSTKIYEIGNQSGNHIIDKLRKYKRVKQLVEEIKPDVVLTMPEEIGIYVLWILRHKNIPIIVSERNNPYVMPNKKVTRLMRKIFYPKAAGLIFQTEKAAEFFSEKIRKKGVILPNPLDLSRIPAIWEGKREKTIVSAGRLEPQKNFSLLIEAFSIFYKTHSDYKLIIYGEGQERDRLENLIAERNLQKAVFLPGVNHNLLDIIRRYSLFVLSSDYEGLPNILIEAMAIGLPCVSTDCEPGGAASIIEDGKNGILVPIGNVIRLSEAMSSMIDDEVLFDTSKVNALQVKEKYDSRVVSAKWLDFIKTVIENKK